MEIRDYQVKFGGELKRVLGGHWANWEIQYFLDNGAIVKNGQDYAVATELVGCIYTMTDNFVQTLRGTNKEQIWQQFLDFKSGMKGGYKLEYVNSPLKFVNCQKAIEDYKAEVYQDALRGIDHKSLEELTESLSMK